MKRKYKVLGSRFQDEKRKETKVTRVCSHVGRMVREYRDDFESRAEIFAVCKTSRPQKKKVSNTLYREQAGVSGSYIHTMRFEGSYITKVCKSRMY